MVMRVLTSKVVAILSCVLVLVVGIWLGGHPKYLPAPVADVLVGNEGRRAAIEGLDAIHDKYYRSVSTEKLSDSALKGAVASLKDRFSGYYSEKEYAQFNKAINNQFSGVGTTVQTVKAGLKIVMIYPKSPADKARVQVGDVIVAANGHKLAGLSDAAAVAFVKGPEGTKVTLRLRRGKRTLVKRLTRATISVPVVESRIANAGGKRVAYIALSTFGPGTAHEQVA